MDILNCSIASERSQRLDLLGGEPPDLTSSRRSLLELPTTVVVKHVDQAGPFLQERLAEALRSRSVVRLGGDEPHPVAARVIVTLRKPVPALRKEGRIIAALADLLAEIRTIRVPPLRERPEDIPALAAYYHEKFRSRSAGDGSAMRPGLVRFLRAQEWEDNVRDLVACVRSLVVFAVEDELIQREKLELMKMLTLLEQGSEFSLEESMARIRRSIIGRAVRKQNGHQQKSAELLGLSDREIRRILTR